MRIKEDKKIDFMPKKALKHLQDETFETLTKHGRGVWCEQLCLWAGLSEYGTAKKKAARLMAWKDGQND